MGLTSSALETTLPRTKGGSLLRGKAVTAVRGIFDTPFLGNSTGITWGKGSKTDLWSPVIGARSCPLSRP